MNQNEQTGKPPHQHQPQQQQDQQLGQKQQGDVGKNDHQKEKSGQNKPTDPQRGRMPGQSRR